MIKIFSPLEQFEIIPFFFFYFFQYPLFFFDFFIFIIFINLFFNKNKFNKISNFEFKIHSLFYIFIYSMLIKNINLKAASFFPYFFTLFFFLIYFNILSLLPYSFTLNSHLFITFWYSVSFFFSANFIGALLHRFKLLALWLPRGVPFWLVWLMWPIEFLSYISRVFSLAIRLFANLMSGHILLHLFISSLFFFFKFKDLILIILIPFIFILFILIIESAIALIQAYVFLVLTLLYLKDTFLLEH